MRRLLLALGMIGLASSAVAGDFPVLRGSDTFVPAPPTYTRWSGFYAGGQWGYSGASVDFSNATQELVAFALRETALENESHPSLWQVLGKTSTSASSYGAFAGFNTQWEDVILGFELNYNRSSFMAVAPLSPLTRATGAGGNVYVVTLTGSGSMRITDVGTLRARFGYAAGSFLPYLTGGFAVGRADIARSALISLTENGAPFTFSGSESKEATFVYGWAVGAGLDVAVMSNVFLRGEAEYVNFAPISGMHATITSARIGAGLKF
jgi:outer membrane immunogenic protein